MDAPTITVRGKPFMGRVEEQKQFRAALQEVIHPPRGETLPYVILLYGDGGIGKTTLACRFRDIACGESPFRGQVETLWVDWEAERDRWAELQVGREHIHPETVFDVLYTLAGRAGWEKHFETYRKTREERKKAESLALQALQPTGERDELALLRGLGAEMLAALVRRVIPIGDRGEELTRVFLEYGIQEGAEALYALRQSIERRLRTRLGVRQLELYLNPHEHLARALADGFKRLSHHKPLLVVLDTYEIVDRADPWLRLVIQTAGPRILWVLSGRDNLRDSRPWGERYFRGYAEDFPRRLLAYDLAQLALEDVKTYFALCVPDRPLDEEAAQAIRRATRGIPLAVTQAAEMWARGVLLNDIVGDTDEAVPGREIVRRMLGRYLLHAVREEDQCALYALALARGDLELLRAMLAPAGGGPFNLEAELRRLERDYASVVAFEGRLHDEPQAFFVEYLRDPLRRQSDPVRSLLARAEAALRARLERLERDLPLMEERHADDDWRRTVLMLTDVLFWQDEERAWRFFLPRFLESLAYSRDLRHGLLQTATRWERSLSTRGKRRLQALRVVEDWWLSPDEERALLEELTRAAERGDLAGAGEEERLAILHWRRGEWLARQGRHAEALAEYGAAERGLPKKGEVLREKLAEALYNLAGALMWPDSARFSVYHPDAVRIMRNVTAWLPQKPGAWYRLGTALVDAGQNEEAIVAYQQAIELDPKYAHPWNGLGRVYYNLGRYEEAIEAFQRAIALDPKFPYPWNGLGWVYYNLGQYEEAIEAYQRAIALDPKLAAPWNGLGGVCILHGAWNKSLEFFQKATEVDSQDPLGYSALLWVATLLGNRELALGILTRAIEADLRPPPKSAMVEQITDKMPNLLEQAAQINQPEPYLLVSLLQLMLGQAPDASASFQKVLQIDPQFFENLDSPIDLTHPLWVDFISQYSGFFKRLGINAQWYAHYLANLAQLLARICHNQGRLEEAIAAYQQAIALDPKDAYPWNNLGNVYRVLGRYEEAIEAYQRAIALDPKDAYPWNGLGVVHALRGEWEQALEAFRRALELVPEDGMCRTSLAGALQALGREEEAREELEQARPLMEKESEYNRARFAALCGETEEALHLLEIALQKWPGLRLWARHDPDLRSLHSDPRFWQIVAQD